MVNEKVFWIMDPSEEYIFTFCPELLAATMRWVIAVWQEFYVMLR